MSDVNAMLIEPLTKFVKDSAYLVKKCTKPDLKGAKKPLLLVTVRRLKSMFVPFSLPYPVVLHLDTQNSPKSRGPPV